MFKFASFLFFAVLCSACFSQEAFPLSEVRFQGPNSNIFALCALAAIVLGLVVGVISLFAEKTTRVWWRLLIGVLYLPTAVCSLLLAGF
jgi:hypothetical protein